MMNTMLQKILAVITVVGFLLLALMLTTTTPATAGPFGLLLIFISAYLTCVGLISFFLYGFSRVFVYVSAGFNLRKPPQIMSFKRAYYFATVLAAAPVLLIGLQSVGSVGFYEVGLVIFFEVIACLYVAKRIS